MALGVKPGHFIHPKNDVSWGFNMIFFGIAWAFFCGVACHSGVGILWNPQETIFLITGAEKVFSYSFSLVAEQPGFGRGKRFRGDYCLMLESSQDVLKTLEPNYRIE